MKRYLKGLFQLSLVSTCSLTTISCTGRWFKEGLDPGEPPNPDEKDIEYYQSLIEENNINIKDCQEWIDDIEQELKAGEITKSEAEEEIGAINAEINSYHAQISEYQYQILLLRGNGKITIIEKPEAIICLTEKINYLNQELALRKKYPGDYSEEELQTLANNIKEAEKTLEEILKIEEGE